MRQVFVARLDELHRAPARLAREAHRLRDRVHLQAPPKPPPSSSSCSVTASVGMPIAAAAARRANASTCVEAQIVQRPSRNGAVAFIGSIFAYAR